MNEISLQRFAGARHHVQSWALSAFVHGLAVGAAVLVLGDLKLAPKPEPFKWDVALVEPPPKPVAQPSAPTPAQKQAEPKPVERQAMVMQAAPPPQAQPTPVAPRQEPVQPVVEKKPEP
ncbi:MAG: hypothetical protein KGN30_06965, partial [Nitrospirota bacterium]|nr:hypothetical protein [Nitrospirota bacterium]